MVYFCIMFRKSFSVERSLISHGFSDVVAKKTLTLVVLKKKVVHVVTWKHNVCGMQ